MAKVKIPRQVAGVKIPKKVRKKAKKAIRMARDAGAGKLAASALGAAAEAKVIQLRTRASRGGRAAAGASVDAERLVATIRTAALDGLQRFLEGFEEGLKKADREAGEVSARREAE